MFLMFLPFVTWPLLVQVRCEYSMAAFSTGERRRRGKSDRYSVVFLSPTSWEFSISWSKEYIPTILEGWTFWIDIGNMQIFLSLGVPHFSSLDLCCRRAMELSLVIRQTLEAAILTHLMPRSQVKSLAGFVPREWTYLSGLVCSCNSLSFLDLWIGWKCRSCTHKTVNAGTAHVVHALQL